MLLDRVDVVQQFSEWLHTGISCHIGHVCHVQSAVEVEHDALRREGLTAVGDVGAVSEILRPHVLEPLSAIERQDQVLLLFRRLHHA